MSLPQPMTPRHLLPPARRRPDASHGTHMPKGGRCSASSVGARAGAAARVPANCLTGLPGPAHDGHVRDQVLEPNKRQRAGYALALAAVVAAGALAVANRPKPEGVVLRDPGNSVSEARYIPEPDAPIPFDLPLSADATVQVPAPAGWDTRVLFMGGACDDGVRLVVTEDGSPVTARSFSYASACTDQGVLRAVDLRWASEPASAS